MPLPQIKASADAVGEDVSRVMGILTLMGEKVRGHFNVGEEWERSGRAVGGWAGEGAMLEEGGTHDGFTRVGMGMRVRGHEV